DSPAVGAHRARMFTPVHVLAHELIDDRPGTLCHLHARFPAGWSPGWVMAPNSARTGVFHIDFRGGLSLPLPQVRFAQAFIRVHVQAKTLTDDLRRHPSPRQIRGDDASNSLVF